MCLLSPCHGQSSLARAAAPVAEESSGSNCPEPPWECRVGKGLISHVENLSLGLLHVLAAGPAPSGGLWSALRAPFPRGFSSQHFEATKREIWLQPGTALCPLRTSLAPDEAAMEAALFPQGRRRSGARVVALLRALQDQPWVIKNIFAGNPTGFPVMQRGSAACSVPGALNTDDRTRTGSLCPCPERVGTVPLS